MIKQNSEKSQSSKKIDWDQCRWEVPDEEECIVEVRNNVIKTQTLPIVKRISETVGITNRVPKSLHNFLEKAISFLGMDDRGVIISRARLPEGNNYAFFFGTLMFSYRVKTGFVFASGTLEGHNPIEYGLFQVLHAMQQRNSSTRDDEETRALFLEIKNQV